MIKSVIFIICAMLIWILISVLLEFGTSVNFFGKIIVGIISARFCIYKGWI